MNVWFRRLLLILTIGGGFVGVARTIQFFSHVDKVIAYVVLLAFVCLYGYGIFLGVKLSEGPAPLRHLRVYFGLQIPFISSPIVAYRFATGFQTTIAITQSGLGWDVRFLGSEGQFAILCYTFAGALGSWHQRYCIGHSVSSVFSIGGRAGRRHARALTIR